MTDLSIAAAGRDGAQLATDLLDRSVDCVKAISLDGRLLSMNPEGMCLMEIDDITPLQGAAWSSLWPEAHRGTLEAAVVVASQGKVARFSADCPTAKGTPKHWDVVVSPVHNAAGELVNLLAISRDVTQETLVAGERALVSRELAHRMANMFTVVDGIISLSMRAHPLASSFSTSLRDRISSLGRAMAYVYSGSPQDARSEAGHTVLGLFQELLSPYQDAKAASQAVVVSGDDHRLSAYALTPLALVINELATNALKYGALSQPAGRVQVSTKLVDGDYVIEWRETGASLAGGPEKVGFGTTLLDRTVKRQLGASLSRTWSADGLVAEMRVPLSSLR